jgi:hypothetical protein
MTVIPEDKDTATAPTKVNRRGLVGGLVLGSAALGAGAVGGLASRASAGSGFRRKTLVVEVACLGEIWREGTKANAVNDADFRASFVVEGWIYPEGTIKGDGFIPREDGSIGRWFCSGEAIVDASRQQPHTHARTSYYFGAITSEKLFPRNSLHTTGLEGTIERTQTCWRAITGGTGEYVGAIGEMGERLIATNTSLFADGTNDPAPCWRCEFDLRILD